MTIPQAKKYIKETYGEAKHNISSLVKACRKTAKKYKIDAYDVFFLMIENKPIDALYTHSYGFHTSNGRQLIEETSNHYYQIERAK